MDTKCYFCIVLVLRCSFPPHMFFSNVPAAFYSDSACCTLHLFFFCAILAHLSSIIINSRIIRII